MSADIIQFIPRPGQDRAQTNFPTIAFRTSVPDRDVDCVDTAPSEYLPSDWEEK
jgi:hypothetical protein